MELARINVHGIRATPVYLKKIPKGIVGATVKFDYTDPVWNDLNKTVVFRGCVTRDVLNAGEVVTIPAEVVERAGVFLHVGVYGVDADNNVVIPTLWADLGKIWSAADPSGDESANPSLPVWAQLDERVRELEENGTGGSVGPEEIQKAVEDYLEENPLAQFKLDEETIVLENGVLGVKTVEEAIEGDIRPITSGAVYDEFSKAVALLRTI